MSKRVLHKKNRCFYSNIKTVNTVDIETWDMTTNWNLCKERTTLYFKSQKKHGLVKAYANFSLTEALLNRHFECFYNVEALC